MNHIEWISEESKQNLFAVLGKELWVICSSSFELRQDDFFIVAPDIIIPIGFNSFIHIYNEIFGDTPNEYINYFSIVVEKKTIPIAIEGTGKSC